MQQPFIWLSALWLMATPLLGDELPPSPPSSLYWYDQYEEASEVAKGQNRPLLLFFTGSDWCSSCSDLEKNILKSPSFAQEVKESFVLVKLDFPLYQCLEPQIAAQNKQLRRKLDIRNFPALVLLDPKGKKIGEALYRASEPVDYARQFKKMASDFASYREELAAFAAGKIFKAEQLRSLYERAKIYEEENEAVALLKEGLKGDDPFFIRERYRFLADEGHIHSKEAQQLKARLEQIDPDNRHHLLYDVAFIEFEAYCDEMAKENYAPELAVAPLVNYIEKYGERDIERAWRLEMVISQVFLNHNQPSQALLHAKSCYRLAPPSVRPEIAIAIENLQTQTQKR